MIETVLPAGGRPQRSGLAGQSPALRVVLAGLGRERHRRDGGADLHLLVRPLDGGLERAAVRLTPNERHLGPDLDGRVDDAERELEALVVAVPGEQRQADEPAVERHRVVVGRGVVRDRHVQALGRDLVGEQRGRDLARVLLVPRERHLPALRRLVHRLQGLAADEVVVEPDHVAVAELVGGEVVVLDVLRYEAAAERSGEALVAAGREPLAVRLQLLAGVDGGQRRRDPAGLEGVGRVGAGADRGEAELLARLQDRVPDLEVLLVRAEDLESGLAGHAVPERGDLPALDGDEVGAEELDVRDRAAVQLLDHLGRVGPLDLEPVLRPGHGLAKRARRRAVVADELDVPVAGLRVELDPVHARRPADELVDVLLEVEQDAVADDIAVVGDGHELLGHVGREVLERVEADVGDQLEGIRTLDVEVRHVVALVEQHRGLLPGDLLRLPVGELGRDDRIDVSALLGVPQQLNGVGRLQQILKASLRHTRVPAFLCYYALPRPAGYSVPAGGPMTMIYLYRHRVAVAFTLIWADPFVADDNPRRPSADGRPRR